MNKNLQSYIDSLNKAAEAQKSLKEEEILNLMNSKAAIDSNIKVPKEKSLFSKLGGIKMSIISAITIGAIFSIFSFGSDNENVKSVPVEEYTKDIKQEVVLKVNTTKQNELKESFIEKDTIKIPIIFLTNEEAKKLYIEYTESSYSYYYENAVGDDHIRKAKLIKKGYPENIENFQKKLNFLGGKKSKDSKRESKIVEYAYQLKLSKNLLPIYELVNWRVPSGAVTYRTSLSNHLYYGDYNPGHLYKEILDLGIKKIKHTLEDKEEIQYIEVSKKEFPYASNTFPICLYDRNNDEGYYTLIWYLTSEEIVNLLPNRYKNFIKSEGHISNEIKDPENYKLKIDKKSNHIVDDLVEIDFATPVLLTKEELQKINIFCDEQGISIKIFDTFPLSKFPKDGIDSLKKYGYPTDGEEVTVCSENYFSKYGNNIRPAHYMDINSKNFDGIELIAVSTNSNYSHFVEEVKLYDTSKVSNSYSPKDKEAILDMGYSLDKLIPVEIIINYQDPDDENIFTNLKSIFWFAPTPEFISKLPERYSDRLRTELEIIDEIENNNVEPSKACEKLNKESVLGVCKLGSERIKELKVYPNPIESDQANVTFKVEAECKINISIYSITGALVKSFPKEDYFKSNVILNLDLSDVSNGFYYLVISSDKGDEVMVKIMK